MGTLGENIHGLRKCGEIGPGEENHPPTAQMYRAKLTMSMRTDKSLLMALKLLLLTLKTRVDITNINQA